MQIIIFGSPGVGKGTQAKILAVELGIAHISTGDILREAIKKETDLGKKAKEIVESGGLVPDEIMAELIKDVLLDERCKNGFILDGFPRTIQQAHILNKILSELNYGKPILIKLDAKDEIIISRLSNRLVCSKCGNIIVKTDYTENYSCPVCKTINSYIKRKDDDEEVIRRRLKVYHETTAPVFEFYHDKAIIIEIDGAQEIDCVTSNILEKMKTD
jgi:adenylate kinase